MGGWGGKSDAFERDGSALAGLPSRWLGWLCRLPWALGQGGNFQMERSCSVQMHSICRSVWHLPERLAFAVLSEFKLGFFMSDFLEHLRRALIPNGRQRAPWHDYRSKCIYMITLNSSKEIGAFSSLTGIPGDRQWPPRAVNTSIGEIIAANISALKGTFPFVKILRRVIMPDHVHFVIFIERPSDTHLGDIINHLKKRCTQQFRALYPLQEDASVEDTRSVFEEGYHDRILLKRGQLQKMLNYVSDNPRRRLLRELNPGFHNRYIIQNSKGEEFEVYGNIGLLFDPDIEAVKISRKYSLEALRSHKICWKHTVENCGVLVSPFISEDEKKVYNWAIKNGGRIIYIFDNGLGKRFAPKGVQHVLCSEGRLLIVARREYQFGKVKISRGMCEDMNQLALEITNGGVKVIS